MAIRFRDRVVVIKLWKILAVLVLSPILILWGLVVHQLDEIVSLTRSEVITDASGTRKWYGTFTNTDDIPYTEVAIEVVFLDADNEVVSRIKKEMEILQASEGLSLESVLPKEAVRLRVQTVRWRNEHTSVFLGPFRKSWEFGYLMSGS